MKLLETVGFKTSDADFIRLETLEIDNVTAALEAIMLHVSEQGGKVKKEETVDAASTVKQKMPGMDNDLRQKYDPTAAINTIEEIKKQRSAMMEGTLSDRNIAVFNFGNVNP